MKKKKLYATYLVISTGGRSGNYSDKR